MNRIHTVVSLLLFSFLFIYILLRILYTDTLHDEVATYMFYFYQGDYIGETIQWDANNHLLNSFIGHQLYKVFGDQISILRLPNLFAFILYFYGTYKLTSKFVAPYLKTLSLVALNSIPFIMEYFGNARGYGLSMGFFVLSIYHIINHLQSYNLRSLFLGYLFLGLAVSANLTFINTSLIILVLCIVAPYFEKVQRSGRQLILEWGTHFILAIGLVPFILFGFALKKAGALYYGRLDGIWDVTGKTLSRYVLFTEGDWLMFIFLFLFILILIGCVIILRKTDFQNWLKSPLILLALLFFGNLIAIELLAQILEVNYPEDRTGMYLIILFLLMIFHLFEQFKFGKWLQWSMLFFPITLFTHLSVETSVFSPDDRLNSDFFKKVKTHITPESSIMIYHIINWNWPYHESHESTKASVAQFDNPNGTLTDIIVTKTTVLENPEIALLYDTIAYHEPSTYIAFKRKQPMLRIGIDTTEQISNVGPLEYVDIATISTKGFAGKDLQLTIKGHLRTYQPRNKIQLVVQGSDEKGESSRYYYYSFETTYQSQLINDEFLHHFVLENITKSEKEIKVYLWNRGLHHLELNDANCIVSELKSPEDELR